MNTLKRFSPYVVGIIIFSLIYCHQNHVDNIKEVLQIKHLKFIFAFFLLQCLIYVFREHIIKKRK
ncbi:hypothetical protein BK146_24920 [Paenibacillus sp. FSL R7-0333]|nr:hypothetical protein BK146_24920 [Paenibacillus sp. FSL R7-0333]